MLAPAEHAAVQKTKPYVLRICATALPHAPSAAAAAAADPSAERVVLFAAVACVLCESLVLQAELLLGLPGIAPVKPSCKHQVPHDGITYRVSEAC